MKNPFLAHKEFESKPKRNAFDNSHRCFLTGKLGCLYPCMTLEVSAGDSVQIDASFLLNFFPFIFPVQTPMRASLYFFYGRNRIFMDSWQDFAYNNKQPSHPFILQPNGPFWQTGSLSDYLGVPTTYASLGQSVSYSVYSIPRSITPPGGGSPVTRTIPVFFDSGLRPGVATSSFFEESYLVINQYTHIPWDFTNDRPSQNYWALAYEFLLTSDNVDTEIFLRPFSADLNNAMIGRQSLTSTSRFVVYDNSNGNVLGVSVVRYSDYSKVVLDSDEWVTPSGNNRNLYTDLLGYWSLYPNARFRIAVFFIPHVVGDYFSDQYADPLVPVSSTQFASSLVASSGQASVIDLSALSSNPFSGTIQDPPKIPLNAIPYRFYEAVYNAYFRDERNDPFMVNGELEYNKWNTTRADGADSTPYRLYYRNWEADFLTTATQTPQQGLAPLVGINVRGDMEFLNDDGTITRIRPTIAADGTTITGVSGVVSNGTPEAMRSALELITTGISINDFRQVSSLQSWLENNLRRGLKYRDQVLANTGVKIKYDELDMPEFIGGFSRPVQVTSITQATPSTDVDNALGDRAGQASVLGGSRHNVTHYCDEAGFIMAVLCVYPQPVYTQLLPKYFLKSDALSYYHPQFGSIGMQPISYREVCPVQVYQESGDLDATFGYQRPWYDLISNVDTAHGNMRTNMRDFLMHRTFAGIPHLGADFLHIDPKQLNNVFAITDDTEDVFQGQIYFNVFTKRAIPRFGIPRQI